MSLFIQRNGSVSAIAKRAWLEPWVIQSELNFVIYKITNKYLLLFFSIDDKEFHTSKVTVKLDIAKLSILWYVLYFIDHIFLQ